MSARWHVLVFRLCICILSLSPTQARVTVRIRMMILLEYDLIDKKITMCVLKVSYALKLFAQPHF